ncbi:MAG: NUDIX hydrolase [Betaproteobacteria bacterium]|nr:NUDIX hydrolase [Betaproteobacteria bacterium]
MTAYIEHEGLRLRRKVRAVVLNEIGEVLLVRPHGYREGEWTLAGGGVEEGESPIEAIRREIAEELGVTLEDEFQVLPVSNRFIYSPDHRTRRALDHDGQDATMFAVQLPSDVQIVMQAEEIAEVRWFSREEALGAFPVRKQREIFEACLGKIAV